MAQGEEKVRLFIDFNEMNMQSTSSIRGCNDLKQCIERDIQSVI